MPSSEPSAKASPFTIALGATRSTDLPQVGGKAANLAKMLTAGLPVPAGFVITTAAYARFLEADAQISGWLQTLDQHDPQDIAGLRSVSAGARARLSRLAMPAEVAGAIAAELRDAGAPDGAWAVRSSATAEDLADASFAGQHDSFLNVRGREAVLEAVKRCWLSLFSDRALSYRRRKGIASDRAQMAVVVQRLVAAEAAGVLFTADPSRGDSGRICIEAAFGLGEALVQGKVTPDRIQLSRSPVQVVGYEAAQKHLQIVSAADGVSERALAADRAGARVLDEDTAVRLAKLGLEAERVLGGGPLDIEWGLCQQDLWLFQARAVTTRGPKKADHQDRKPATSTFEDRQVWTNANAGEVLPDVVTPMTLSVLRRIARRLWGRLLWSIGLQVTEDQLYSCICGRVYLNFNSMCALGRYLPGKRKQDLGFLLGGRQDVMLALQEITIAEADLPSFRFSYWRLAIGLPLLARRSLCFSTREAEAAVESQRQVSERRCRIDPGSLSQEGLLRELKEATGPGPLGDMKAADAFAIGPIYTAALFGLCEQWFGSEGRSMAHRLLGGVGELDSAAIGHDLWLLAEQAASDAQIRAAVLSEHTFSAFKLRLERYPSGSEFLTQWDTFVHRHGHHTRGELELMNPRWAECPDFVLGLVRGYVQAIAAGHPSPTDRHDVLASERLELTQRCLKQLRNPVKRVVFRLVLHRAQKGSQFRENIKSEAIRWVGVLRQLLLEAGKRLAASGRLADQNDIFFLETDDLENGSLWDLSVDLRERVARQRALYESYLKITPPAVIVGRFDPHACVLPPIDPTTKLFQGLGVSAGKVTGRARVILRSDTQEQIQPGEILVAPFTDPGWTPYFLAAGGIVMDLGGMLSHGSIVAREYGIPAVVNVGPATQIIQTGQWLEVDADLGTVKLLETGGCAAQA